MISSLSYPGLRTSITINYEVDHGYRALSTLDATSDFGKATFRGVEIYPGFPRYPERWQLHYNHFQNVRTTPFLVLDRGLAAVP